MTLTSREAWGAEPPKPNCEQTRPLSVIDTAIVHYADAAATTSPASDEAMCREIQRFHQQNRGWCDIAYHRLIGNDGQVYEGRPLDVVGAHALGHNATTIGYCFLTDGDCSDEAWRAFSEQHAADETELGKPLRVIGHRDVVSTSCPGDAIYARVQNIGHAAPAPTPGPAPEPQPSSPCNELEPGPAPAGHRMLSYVPGHRLMSGADVAQLQADLAAAGRPPADSRKADGSWDGVFGPGVAGAVRQLEADHHLHVDEGDAAYVGRQVYCVLGIR